MEFKDDGKPKQMTWRFFRPAPKPKPEPSVAPQKIILVPSKQTQNPQNAFKDDGKPKQMILIWIFKLFTI